MASNIRAIAFWTILSSRAGQTQRATLAVALGDVHPFGGQRLIFLSLESRHQVRDILVEVLTPLMPAYSVDATGLLLAERLVAPPQELFVQQMSKARELELRVLAGSL